MSFPLIFPVLIDSNGLNLHDISNLYFHRKSKLIMQPTGQGTFYMLNAEFVHNILICFPVLIGDRDCHLGKTGEFGHGIYIYCSYYVGVYYTTISKCWGDGILIYNNTISKVPPVGSQHIDIAYPTIDDSRRDAISVTSVNGLIINGAVLSNSNGTNPQSGIDIETGENSDDFTDISIPKLITFNNKAYGIIVSLSHLRGKNLKTVSILVDNHINDASFVGEAV